jgi:Protein of unknown function (DUF1553)/Protein of unknown function (DUF1549)
MSTNWVKTIAALVGIFSVIAASRFGRASGAEQRSISMGDCTFATRPDDLLARESRLRRDVSATAVKLNKVLPRTAAAPRAATSMPRRNFIDDYIFGAMAAQQVPSARLTTDAEFFRRINLDLIGKIPAPDEVRAFIADTTPTKRDDAIDRLLYSPEFVDRWTMWMGDLLQNTSASSNVSRQVGGRDAFYWWIQQAVNSGTSLRDIAYATIVGQGNTYDPKVGNTNFDYGMTTPMGPIQDTYDTFVSKTAQTYLGIAYYDCLLCHNGRGHLDSISLWGSQVTRAQAWQMSAFFSRVRMARNPAPNGQPLYLSEEITDAASGTYDLNTTYGNRPNRQPLGTVKSMTPVYRDGQTPPDGKGTWRDAYAALLTADPMFARNFANRLWKQFFNLGLVDPVDTMDPARLDPNNPPPAPWTLQASNPQLLERLAGTLADNNFGLREFIRIIVQSNAYQLSSRYDGDWSIDYVPLYARHYPRRLDGEEIADAIVKATGVAGGYTAPGWTDSTVAWAMQLPDTVSGGPAAAFMNTFLRGNRDTQPRSQAGSILQQLTLMNDAFVTNRTKVAASPVLANISKLTDNDAAVEQLFLTFLSRYPSDTERQLAVNTLKAATTATLRNNAIEDLAWVMINKLDFLFSY